MRSSNHIAFISSLLANIKEAINNSDMEMLKKCIDASTINRNLDQGKCATPLFMAACEKPNAEIVKYILQHPNFDCLQNSQFEMTLNTVINKYWECRQLEVKTVYKNILILLFSDSLFYSNSFYWKIKLSLPAQAITEASNDDIIYLAALMLKYAQELAGARHAWLYSSEIQFRQIIAENFQQLGALEAAAKWLELANQSVDKLIKEDIGIFDSNKDYANHRRLITQFESYLKTFNESAERGIACPIEPKDAFTAALILGNLSLNVNYQSHLYTYFHMAKNISKKYQLEVDLDVRKFLDGATELYPVEADNSYYPEYLSLIKNLEFLSSFSLIFHNDKSLSYNYLAKKSRSKILSYSLMASYLLELRTYPTENKETGVLLEKYSRELSGLQNLYGLDGHATDFKKASTVFMEIVMGYRGTDNNRVENAALLFFIAQNKFLKAIDKDYQIIINDAATLNNTEAEKSVIAAHKNNFEEDSQQSLIEILKIGKIILSHHLTSVINYGSESLLLFFEFIKILKNDTVILFELILDFYRLEVTHIQNLVEKPDRIRRLNLFQQFIADKINDLKILENSDCMDMYLNCMADILVKSKHLSVINFVIKQMVLIKNKAKNENNLTLLFKTEKLIIEACLDSNIVYSEESIKDLISYIEEMEVIAPKIGKNFKMESYARFYGILGDTVEDKNEKITAYQTAINLFDTKSVKSLLEMSIAKDDDVNAFIKVLHRAIKNAILETDNDIIRSIHQYISKNAVKLPVENLDCEQFAKLEILTVKANQWLNNKINMQGILNTILILIKKMKDGKTPNIAHYIFSRILCEFALGKEILMSKYGFTETEIAAFTNHLFSVLTQSKSPTLATSYLSFYEEIKEIVKKELSDKKENSSYIIPFYDIDTLMLSSSNLKDVITQVKEGMSQTLGVDSNYFSSREENYRFTKGKTLSVADENNELAENSITQQLLNRKRIVENGIELRPMVSATNGVGLREVSGTLFANGVALNTNQDNKPEINSNLTI